MKRRFNDLEWLVIAVVTIALITGFLAGYLVGDMKSNTSDEQREPTAHELIDRIHQNK